MGQQCQKVMADLKGDKKPKAGEQALPNAEVSAPRKPITPGAVMVERDPHKAQQLDAMDGVMDGKYFGVPITTSDPYVKEDSRESRPRSPKPQPYDPRPGWATRDGYYTTHSSDRVVWGDLPPRDAVMAVDQEDAYLLDMADGELDGTYFGRPIGVHSQLGLASLPPQFGTRPPQYRPPSFTGVRQAQEGYGASYLSSAPPPKPLPPPPINFNRLPDSQAMLPSDYYGGPAPYGPPPSFSRPSQSHSRSRSSWDEFSALPPYDSAGYPEPYSLAYDPYRR